MKKILSIVGARPQFIKAAIVSNSLRENGFREILLHTGQHYDKNMDGLFFKELELPEPDYNLGVGSGTHAYQTGEMLKRIEDVLVKELPALVIVYGDTNSTLAGALAGVKLHVPVAHVEAGLRSFNRKMPEEINRIVADHVSDILFPPTKTAVKNLLEEGIPEEKIYRVGDVMYDASLYYGEKAENESRILGELGVEPKRYILGTIHRAENTDDSERLKRIFEELIEVSLKIPVVVPLHPRTRKDLLKIGIFENVMKFVKISDPVGYLDMIMLEKNAKLIITDSGGVQKEAYFYEVPCITLRNETEWVELVELGWNKLVSPNREEFDLSSVLEVDLYPKQERYIFGRGNAGKLIADFLKVLL